MKRVIEEMARAKSDVERTEDTSRNQEVWLFIGKAFRSGFHLDR